MTRLHKIRVGSIYRAGFMAVAAALTLSGCVSLGTKPPDELLRLTAQETAPAGTTSSGQLSEAIVVLDPEADRGLDVLRVPVTVDASSVAYLKDALWIEKPTRQFRSVLAETLRARTGKLVVEGGDFEVTGRTLIGGRLLQMGYDAQRSAVVVRFDAVRTDRGGTPLQTRRFEAVVNGVEAKAKPVGAALNQAANDVARQVADWVKG
ncbi:MULTISPECIES: ABC-type transport auxiliary lipoprotein family protein [unclassified Novosphingobium]|uniref:ABC-type transport auxiliary lipoprotein family protein n=1 Tax=unclassified Novosphingobium TaxID=2644732 RepID=UPI00135B785E|nr:MULTISPECIES: ABC-type transport auxiliary lipoprotein family protein [unclassified Novosphingobium]